MITLLVVLLVLFLVLAVSIGIVLWRVPVARWYVAAIMAKFDFIFTEVPEGKFKEVVRFRAHKRTLMAKEGFKINDNGRIVPLAADEPPQSLLPGGLGIIGLPGIDRIYTRQMKFSKSLLDGIKPYDIDNVSEFYAMVDYPYALPFVKCEDMNNLPVSGYATLLAHVDGPTLSLFATTNFYDTMVGLVLPVVQECLRQKFDFDNPTEKNDLDTLMWEELNEQGPGGADSVIEELHKKYAVRIVAFRTVQIDPPEEFRATSLIKWTAKQRANAADAVAEAEQKEAAGPIELAMEKWIEKEAKDVGETVAEAKKRLRESGEYKEHKKLLADQINRSRKTVQERVININSGGEPLEGGSIASIAGAIAAAIIGATAGKGIKDENDAGNNPGGGKKKNRKDQEEDDKDDLRDDLDK